jgi:hypothetical protein
MHGLIECLLSVSLTEQDLSMQATIAELSSVFLQTHCVSAIEQFDFGTSVKTQVNCSNIVRNLPAAEYRRHNPYCTGWKRARSVNGSLRTILSDNEGTKPEGNK